MLHISQQHNGLNLQSDMDCLHQAYLSVLDKLEGDAGQTAELKRCR